MTYIDRAISADAALKTLGLASMPTQNELRSVRRKLIFDNHPDKCDAATIDLAEIDQAYNILLCMCQNTAEPAPSRADNLPRRPKSRERVEMIANETRVKCGTLLERLHSTSSAGKRQWSSFEDMLTIRDHVPSQVKRCGRDVSYLISSPLKEGMNHIALPTGELVDKRKEKIEIVKLKSKRAGDGTYNVPAAQLAARFPGARSVQLQFQAV